LDFFKKKRDLKENFTKDDKSVLPWE